MRGAFLLGLGLGAFVAAQVGLVSLLLIRSALRHGLVTLARGRVRGRWLVAVDALSGLGLVGFGVVLGVRSVHEA